jgi:hypothetical protein
MTVKFSSIGKFLVKQPLVAWLEIFLDGATKFSPRGQGNTSLVICELLKLMNASINFPWFRKKPNKYLYSESFI